MIIVSGGNENTYDSNCLFFDTNLGCCAHSENYLMSCRKIRCPDHVVIME